MTGHAAGLLLMQVLRALPSLLVVLAACSDPPAVATTVAATAPTTIASPADAADPVDAAPEPPPAPVWDHHPRWMIDVRQPARLASFYRRGLRGRVDGAYHGFIVCQVRVAGGTRWDDEIVGDSRPDLRVTGPTRAVRLPDDTSGGIVGFPDVQLEPGAAVQLEFDDLDPFVTDDIGSVTLIYSQAFPMAGKAGPLTATCLGVPPELYAQDLAALEQKAEQALLAASVPAAIDVEHIEQSHGAIAAARQAIRDWAMLAGPDSAAVLAAVERAEALHDAWKKALGVALEAHFAAAPAEGYQLETGRVRVAPGARPATFELVATRKLLFDWRSKRIGGIKLFVIDDEGERKQPSIMTVKQDGQPLAKQGRAFLEVIPAGQPVEVEVFNIDVLAVVLVEGRRVVVLPAGAP